MADSFGARLRQHRERRQIALTSISRETKIGLPLLEGLERDDVSHWPAGIFRRSFVRAYAQFIGLEPDAVVREFLELYPDPVEARAADPSDIGAVSVSARPQTRLRCFLASAIRSLSRARPEAVQKPGSATADITPAETGAAKTTAPPEPDLSAVARLCTELGRVMEISNVAPLLQRVAGILDAAGLIVWLWDPQASALRPALAHGYSDEVLAKLPRVRRDTDNATAAAFRSAETRIVNGSDPASGAVVVPLLTPVGCVGVLAVELRQGGEQRESVRALASIFAAQLATSVGFAPLAEAVNA